MNDSIWDWRLGDFRDRTASREPTPGGGSVTVVCATLGLGLVIMAAEITHPKAQGVEAERISDLLARARPLLDRLSGHADRDVVVFRDYMQALGLPKQTPEEKAARAAAMRRAAVAATEAPLAAARDALAALDLAREAAALAHKHVISDVAAGADLLGGSVGGILRNVDINLPSLGDSDEARAFAAERTEIALHARAHVEAVHTAIASRSS